MWKVWYGGAGSVTAGQLPWASRTPYRTTSAWRPPSGTRARYFTARGGLGDTFRTCPGLLRPERTMTRRVHARGGQTTSSTRVRTTAPVGAVDAAACRVVTGPTRRAGERSARCVGRPAGDDQLREPAGTRHPGGWHGRQLRGPDGHQGAGRRDAER